MLVHKESLGVLHWLWEGEYATNFGVRLPVMRQARSVQQLGLDPREWWEVENPALVRRILRCYPDFVPVCDEAGNLVDIEMPVMEEPMEMEVAAPIKRRRNRRKAIWEVIHE